MLETNHLQLLLAPKMNAYAERFVKSIKSECHDQMIFPGRDSLVRTITEYVAHYHEERTHQGLGNSLINGAAPQNTDLVATQSLQRDVNAGKYVDRYQ